MLSSCNCMLCEMYTDKHNCYTFERYKNNESLVNLQQHQGSNSTLYVTETLLKPLGHQWLTIYIYSSNNVVTKLSGTKHDDGWCSPSVLNKRCFNYRIFSVTELYEPMFCVSPLQVNHSGCNKYNILSCHMISWTWKEVFRNPYFHCVHWTLPLICIACKPVFAYMWYFANSIFQFSSNALTNCDCCCYIHRYNPCSNFLQK